MINIKVHKLINLFIIICLGVVPLIYIPVGEFGDYFYAPKVFVITIIAVVFLITLLIQKQGINTMIIFDHINITLLVYVILLVVSLFFAYDKFLAINGRPYREEGFSTLIVYFILFLMARSSRLKLTDISKPLLVSSCIISLYGILQYFGIDPFPRDYYRVNWQNAFSTIGNPNFLGTYIVLIFPIALHNYIVKQNNTSAVVYAILLTCLLCTRTRGAWVGALIAFIFYAISLWYFQKKSKPIIIRLVISILLSLFIIFSFNQITNGSLLERFSSISEDATNVLLNRENAEKAGSYRFFIWKRVIEMIKERPIFGFGIENLAEPFSDRFDIDMIAVLGRLQIVDKAHNEYLHIAVTSGVPSLLIYLQFLFNVLKVGFKRLSINSTYWPLFSAIIGYLTQAFFNISVVSVAYIFWIYLGLISSYKMVSTNE